MGELFAGRYELLQPVASGGMGTVWTVRDHTDGSSKVAKILQQSDAASLLRFVREQSVRIDHRHVVTPQSWAGMDDRVLFTMPLVRGGSVADLVREVGPLPVRWVVTLLDQTLQALEAVHAAGIVHRDVKPANLLLEPTGRDRPHLRLTDFGIAAPVDEPRMTRAAQAIGTPGYMAPEQELGADPRPAQDVYAVGVVGLEMLSGVRPPSSGGAQAMTMPWLPGSEPETVARLVALLRRSADPDATARPGTAGALRAELASLDVASLPVAPDERVEVPDRFAELLAQDEALAGAPSPSPHEAPTRGPSVTAPVTPRPTAVADRMPSGATVRGYGLIAVAVICFVLAGVLALG